VRNSSGDGDALWMGRDVSVNAEDTWECSCDVAINPEVSALSVVGEDV
jgi:hypothetical protein